MKLKDIQGLEQCIVNAIKDYSYKFSDRDFTCVARLKCLQGAGNAEILEQDSDIEDVVLLAIQEYFNTDNPKAWAAHNSTAYEIAKFSAQLAQILKSKPQQKERRKRC